MLVLVAATAVLAADVFVSAVAGGQTVDPGFSPPAGTTTTIPTTTTVRGGPRVPADLFGASGELLYGTPLDPTRPAQFKAMATAGVEIVRREAVWSEIEPNAPDPTYGHSFDWNGYDTYLSDMAPDGLRWQPVLGYSTNWSTSVPGNTIAPPKNPADFAAYAAAFAARYGRGGTFWAAHPSFPYKPVTTYEIWNEENMSYWWGNQLPDPSAYATLYEAARQAIRGVDPQAAVIIGGLAREDTQLPTAYQDGAFVAAMVSSHPELMGNIDGVGYHPYAATAAGASSDVLNRTAAMRHSLSAAGLGSVPLYLTEVGWSTAGVPLNHENVTEAQRTQAIQITADQLARSDCNVREYMIHTWVSEENIADPNEPMTSQDRWYGIANTDATLKPSSQAYAAVIANLTGKGPTPPNPAVVNLCGS